MLPLLAIGVLVRVAAVFYTDFWLDEIWGHSWSRRVEHPLDVFTRIHFDTNHWLYTLYMAACGNRANWSIYRLPSLVAGLLCLPAMAWAADEPGAAPPPEHVPPPALVALLMAAVSFPLITYASEARGYACAMLLAVLLYLIQRRLLDARAPKRLLVLFWLTASAGVLFHLTFLFVLASLGVWATLHLFRTEPMGRASRRLVALFAVPAAAFAALYLVDIRHMRHGGAEVRALIDVIGELMAWSTGILPPDNALAGRAIAILGALLLYAAIVVCFRRRWRSSSEWLFFVALFGPVPLLLIGTGADDFTFWTPRHFAMALPFGIILLARAGSRLLALHQGVLCKALLGGMLLLHVCGQLVFMPAFLRDGRGHPMAALQAMAGSRERPLSVASDHDFRNPMLLAFYAERLPGVTVGYSRREQWADGPPLWFIKHSTERKPLVNARFDMPGGPAYILEGEYPVFGFLGAHWFLYRRTDEGGAP